MAISFYILSFLHARRLKIHLRESKATNACASYRSIIAVNHKHRKYLIYKIATHVYSSLSWFKLF